MEELVKEIADLKALVNRLLLRIEELEAENADLRRQLGQNSSNSHKPPSSEGYSKKPLIKAALPKSSGKKPGGQSGHPGKTLQLVEYPDEIHTHSATHCGSCGPVSYKHLDVYKRQGNTRRPPPASAASACIGAGHAPCASAPNPITPPPSACPGARCNILNLC